MARKILPGSVRNERQHRELPPFLATPANEIRIASFLIRQILPPVSEVDEKSLDDLLKLEVPALVAYLNEEDASLRQDFSNYAKTHQDSFIFGVSSDHTISKVEASELPFLVFYNPKDHIPHVLRGAITPSTITKFLERYRAPLIGKFDMGTYYNYTQVFINRLILFIP